MSTFEGPVNVSPAPEQVIPIEKSRSNGLPAKLPVPNEQELLWIASNGENQHYEFKGPGTHTTKIANEVAAVFT